MVVKVSSKLKRKKALSCWLGISFSIVFLRFLGLMQPIEWAFYDFWFFSRPSEPQDNRIVIAAWDEKSLQKYREANLSDRKLIKLIQKIREQQPSIIGLDLIRDIPYASNSLGVEDNKLAFQELDKILRQTSPRILGISSKLPPEFAPHQAFIDTKSVTSADLILDKDEIIRRAYLFPGFDREGNPAGNPSLALRLAIDYLLNKGFNFHRDKSNETISLTSPENSSKISLRPLDSLAGSYLEGELGTEILVNWRKAHPAFSTKRNIQSSFLKISVSEIIEGKIASDVFKDKIVLIGSTAFFNSDVYQTPLNRWTLYNTTGVEVHAHIVSSIISAALDGRSLIKPVPEWSEIILVLLSVGSIVLVVEICSPSYSPSSLFLFGSSTAIAVIAVLVAISYFGFAWGYWIPIVPSVFAAVVSPSIVCLIVYANKIKNYIRSIEQRNQEITQKNQDFQQLIKDSNHIVSNHTTLILQNAQMALSISEELASINRDEMAEVLNTYRKSPLISIKKNARAIMAFTFRLDKQTKTLQEYLRLSGTGNQIFVTKPTKLNSLLKTIIEDSAFFKKYQYDASIQMQENYDSDLEIFVEKRSFSGAIENLIDNAFYAVNQKIRKNPKHHGTVIVKTSKDEDNIYISVSDNGVGINSSVLKQIFKLNFTTKSHNEGHGLGLSIVQETIKRHKGQIKVESIVGEGTIFTISLPLKEK